MVSVASAATIGSVVLLTLLQLWSAGPDSWFRVLPSLTPSSSRSETNDLVRSSRRGHRQKDATEESDQNDYGVEEADIETVPPIFGHNDTCGLPEWIFDLKEDKVFSQYGEDGILLGLIENLGSHMDSKYYVEFGTESGTECNTRVLREKHGWTGLLMDGSHENADIGLHKEIIRVDNIVELFQKHNVPKGGRDSPDGKDDNFDVFSEDTDMSDYYIWREILEAGYRPKILISEINSNFQQSEAVTTHPPPEGTVRFWEGNAYFGVSALGLRHLWNKHGYTMVYCTSLAINCFGVRNDLLGIAHSPQQKTIQECVWTKQTMGAYKRLHSCPPPLDQQSLTREKWSLIGDDGDIIQHDYTPHFYRENGDCSEFSHGTVAQGHLRQPMLKRAQTNTASMAEARHMLLERLRQRQAQTPGLAEER